MVNPEDIKVYPSFLEDALEKHNLDMGIIFAEIDKIIQELDNA